MKLLRSDIIALGTGLTIISVFSLLFYIDITEKIDIGNVEQIGTITFKRKIAQRKYTAQIVWEDVEQNTPVYNNDSIRTADLSDAVVHLKDGTEITLSENSLVLLSFTKDHIDIDFTRGSMFTRRVGVKGKAVKKLNIKSSGATISIEKSNVKLSKDEDDKLNLTVDKGNAKVTTSQGEKIIEKDQKVVISKATRELKVVTLDLKLKNPQSDSYLVTTTGDKDVDLSWEKVKGKEAVFLEVSRDKSFKKTYISRKVTGTSRKLKLKSSAYYWRLRADRRAEGKQNTSDVRKFSVIYNRPVLLISPENRKSMTYRIKPGIIHFKWSENDIASRYTLILAGDPGMKNELRRINTINKYVTFDDLIHGRYYWKILSTVEIGGDNYTSSSRVSMLKIDKNRTMEPPDLIYPPNKKNVSRKVLSKKNFIFSWRKNPEIPVSRFSLARDRGFKNVLFTSLVSVDFLKLKKSIPVGIYYWRVNGVHEKEDVTKPSLIRSINVIEIGRIDLIAPADNRIIVPGFESRNSDVKFVWKRTDQKGRFSIELSNSRDFTTIYREMSGSAYSRLLENIEPGRYFWRVTLLDSESTALMKSGIQSILVKKPLSRPVVVSPSDRDVVDMRRKDHLLLDWKGQKGANLYKIALYRLKSGGAVRIVERNIKGTEFRYSRLNKLDVSRFYWTIQALEIDGKKIIRKSPVAKTFFDISLGEKIGKDKIEIQLPEIIFTE